MNLSEYDEILEGVEEAEQCKRNNEWRIETIDLIDVRSATWGVKYTTDRKYQFYKETFE